MTYTVKSNVYGGDYENNKRERLGDTIICAMAKHDPGSLQVNGKRQQKQIRISKVKVTYVPIK